MKLGDVLRKERLRRGLSVEETAAHVHLSVAEYRAHEGGESPAETWAPILAAIAVELGVPTSRLLADDGRARSVDPAGAGAIIRRHRERRGKSLAKVAGAAGLPAEAYERVEAGDSPIGEIGRFLLGFAELIEQPVFNLVYPCGLPFQSLDDYP